MGRMLSFSRTEKHAHKHTLVNSEVSFSGIVRLWSVTTFYSVTYIHVLQRSRASRDKEGEEEEEVVVEKKNEEQQMKIKWVSRFDAILWLQTHQMNT